MSWQVHLLVSLRGLQGFGYPVHKITSSSVNKATKNNSHVCFTWILFHNWSSYKHYNCDASPSCKVCEISKVRQAVTREPSKKGKERALWYSMYDSKNRTENNTLSRVNTLVHLNGLGDNEETCRFRPGRLNKVRNKIGLHVGKQVFLCSG